MQVFINSSGIRKSGIASLAVFLIIAGLLFSNQAIGQTISPDTLRGLREGYVYIGPQSDTRGSNPYWTVNENVDAYDLVDKLVGFGVTWNNATLSPRNKNAAGTFSGPTSVGFNNGIILTSGRAGDGGSPGELGANSRPNNCGVSVNNGGTTNDPELDGLLSGGQHTQNVCKLEFDFVPQSSKMEFRYVFASEEYSQYVNSSFNDAFGFFLWGPNPGNPSEPYDGKNIAIIPGSYPPTPVTINNVNNGQRGCPNLPGGPCSYCQFFRHVGHDTIQYNGRTTPLSAGAQVVPCSTYHIKLAVGDVSDSQWDSGVFLEANSFQSIGVVDTVAYSSSFIDSIAVEGCNDANIKFTLSGPLDYDFYLPLEISGTAQNGIDYDTVPDTLFIPEGFTSTNIQIVPFDDGDNGEIFETVRIRYNSSLCDLNMVSFGIEIWDPRQFQMLMRDDTIIHCEDSVMLYTIADGFPPYFHVFSTGDTITWIPGNDTLGHTNQIWVNPTNPTWYWVKGWDECARDTVIDSVFIDIVGPTATISNDVTICLGESTTLLAGGGLTYEWSNGATEPEITVTPDTTTTYTVWVYDDCNNWDTAAVTVNVIVPWAYAGEDVTICIGNDTILTAIGGVSYLWSTGETSQSITVAPLVETCYIVWATDDCGNTASDTVCVSVNDDIQADAGADQTICFGDVATLTGYGGILYDWSTGETTQSIEVSPLTTTTYTLTVWEGCYDTDTVIVFVDPLPNVTASANLLTSCYADTVTLIANGADEYLWNSSDPTLYGQENLSNPRVVPLITTVYYLQGTDLTTTCINTDSVVINVRDLLLSDFNPSVFSVCEDDDITLEYIGNASAGATFDWDVDGGNATGSGIGPVYVSWDLQGNKIVSLKVFENGCESDTTKVSITVNPRPEVEFSVDNREGCMPYTLQFNDISTNETPEATFLWDFDYNGSQSVEQNPRFTYPEAGNYTVSLTVSNDVCVDNKTVIGYITVHPLPLAAFSLSPTLTSIRNPEISFTDQSQDGAVSWEWDMRDGTIINDRNFKYSYSDTGTFNVRLVAFNQFGCSDTTYKSVTIKPHPGLYMPSAFTPYSTQGYETYKPVYMGIEQISMTIYDRWGKIIFQTSKLGEGWDGTVDGKPAPTGTYVYHVSFTNNLEQTEELTGTVTLIR